MNESQSVFSQSTPLGKLAILKFLCEQKISAIIQLNKNGKEFLKAKLEHPFALDEYSAGLIIKIEEVNATQSSLEVIEVSLLKKSEEPGKGYIPFNSALLPAKIHLPFVYIEDISSVILSAQKGEPAHI
ncbi:MAG: hypothetical protein WC059_00620 [Candidatus Paceibacterota bacterium]